MRKLVLSLMVVFSVSMMVVACGGQKSDEMPAEEPKVEASVDTMAVADSTMMMADSVKAEM